MFSVYVHHYNPIDQQHDGSDEMLLFTIPNQNGNVRPFLSAVVTNEMGNAGNFEFSVDPASPYYDIWRHMRTMVRVSYDHETIFYGRVLTIDRDMFRTKKIHCEGALTFFMDSVFEGTKNGTTEELGAFLTSLIEAHNTCMADVPEKKIQLGEVPGNYTDATEAVQQIKNDRQKFGNTKGYRTVKEWLDDLVNDYGGYMRIRFSQGTMYLDWLKFYFQKTESNQELSVTSNVIDLSDTVEVNNIFTHVIPVGKNGMYIDGSSGGGGGGGGGSTDTGKYTITLQIEGDGQATVSRTRADEGVEVTMTNTPDSGASFRYYIVNSKGRDNRFTTNKFTMPNSDVIVKAVFTTVKDDDEGIINA